MLAEYRVDGLPNRSFRVTGTIEEAQWTRDLKAAMSDCGTAVEDRGGMRGNPGTDFGRWNSQSQRGCYPPADGGAGDNVEDIVQGPLGTLLKRFENECRVKPSEATAAQAQDLALVGRNLMAGGIKFNPWISAHG